MCISFLGKQIEIITFKKNSFFPVGNLNVQGIGLFSVEIHFFQPVVEVRFVCYFIRTLHVVLFLRKRHPFLKDRSWSKINKSLCNLHFIKTIFYFSEVLFTATVPAGNRHTKDWPFGTRRWS